MDYIFCKIYYIVKIYIINIFPRAYKIMTKDESKKAYNEAVVQKYIKFVEKKNVIKLLDAFST